MNNKSIAVGFVGLIMLSTSVAATEIDFTTSGLGVSGGHAYDLVSMTVDGVKVDVTAYTITKNSSGDISQTQLTGTDIGVYVSGSNNLGVSSKNAHTSNDSHSLDGGHKASDLDEGLLFSFEQAVSLDFVDFDKFGSGDDFNLTVDGITKLVDFDHDSTSLLAKAHDNNDSHFDFFNVVGQEFLFWADGESDSFRIDSINVSAVPAPASLLLLALGLVGLRFNRTRSRA